MSSGHAELARSLYNVDWAAVGARGRGLARASEVLAPTVKAKMSPEVGDRVLVGVSDFAVFVEALEEDFSEFLYDAEEIVENGSGDVSITGVIRARGRRSKMPLSAPFKHTWSFEDDRAVSIEASIG
ncbi:MAG TPA: hypothetical protein VK307_07875 [Thermoleophilaceae bacterium]|nr:hypothetical protein [Thermoleophilaceae bacterium]